VRSVGWGAFCGLMLALVSADAFATDPLFMGRWSIDPSGCNGFGRTAQTTPLVITDRSVDWFQASCSIKKSYRIGEGLYLQAQCFSLGKSRVMPIGLQLRGKKLHVTWDQTAVAGDMQRCR
jgi:hypothetical protein